MRTCPKCYQELKIANRQGVEIDFCPQCRGIWLDAGELEKLIERSSHVSYQQYDAPPGHQQGAAPGYYGGHQPQHHQPQHHQPQHVQHHVQHVQHVHHDHGHYKHHKKYKHHHHPAARFLEEVFDIFD